MKIAIYPGSFDPLTLGHIDIIKRAAPIFDKCIILISNSAEKKSLFTSQERKKLIEGTLTKIKNLEVDINEGLTVDYLKSVQAQYIIRGIRTASDFEHEWVIGNMNKDLNKNSETVVLLSRPDLCHISSRAVKEVALHGGDLKKWVPDNVEQALKKKFKK